MKEGKPRLVLALMVTPAEIVHHSVTTIHGLYIFPDRFPAHRASLDWSCWRWWKVWPWAYQVAVETRQGIWWDIYRADFDI